MRKYFAIELALVTIIAVLLTCSSCSLKQFYPLGGSVLGGAAGAVGGPVTGGIGAGAGWAAGELAKGSEELEEAQDTIQALTTGDVEALVQRGMAGNQTSFDSFVSKIQRILLIAGVCLIIYLAIPIFVAKRCAKTEVRDGLTRAPFPIKPSPKP